MPVDYTQSRAGLIKTWLRDYINANEELTFEEATVSDRRKPFKHTDGHWYIFSAHFARWIRDFYGGRMSSRRINPDLKYVGAEETVFSGVPTGKGSSKTTLRPFKLPVEIVI